MTVRPTISFLFQLLIALVVNRVAFALRFDNAPPPWAIDAFWQMLPWLVAIRAFVFIPFRLYEGLWRYTSIYDLRALLSGVTVSSVLFYLLVRSPIGPDWYARSIFIVDPLILTFALGGLRLTRRLVSEFSSSQPGRRVLIVGAGDVGEFIVRDMKHNPRYAYRPIGFVDDDPSKYGMRIHGVPVLGNRIDLPRLLEDHKPDEVLIALPDADPSVARSIVRVLEPFKIPIKTLPNLHDIIQGKAEVDQIRGLVIDDLLTRAPVGLDERPLQQLMAGRRVMVTGAGGSIGSELCRQIAKLKPASLIMLERYENSLHAIRTELDDQALAIGLHPVIADVTDAQRIDDVMWRHRPEIVFHAAAHKHVPLMEENPCEAIKNNVRGTRIIAKAASDHGVDRFILISTDKAVNPMNMMGASKRLAELVVQVQGQNSGTSFSTVRFGNVLGSNGSVVPRFVQQIQAGGPVTVTDPEIRRFFMLIPEAVQLVLHAAAQADNGATYVLEMGEQVKMVDIARDLIRLAGLVPDEDIKIVFVGLRPGEKLYEELVGPGEDVGPSRIAKVLCVRGRVAPPPTFLDEIASLEEEARMGKTSTVVEKVSKLIGGFTTADAPAPPRVAVAEDPLRIRDPEEQACPQCKTGLAHRSRSRNLVERLRKEFRPERLYRCAACGWRGWMLPMEFGGMSPLESDVSHPSPLLDGGTPPIPDPPAETAVPERVRDSS